MDTPKTETAPEAMAATDPAFGDAFSRAMGNEPTPQADAPAAVVVAEPAAPVADAPAVTPAPVDDVPAEVKEQPWYKTLSERAALAEKFAPVLDGLKAEGIQDAATLQQRQAQAQRVEAQKAEATQVAQGAESYFRAEVEAEVAAAVENGDVSEAYAQTVIDRETKSRTDNYMGQWQAQKAQETAQQDAATRQFQQDARTILAKPEFQVGQHSIPEELFVALSREYYNEPLERIAGHAKTLLSNFANAVISAHTEAEAKKATAARPGPAGSPSVPTPAAYDVKDSEFNMSRALAMQLAAK